MGGITPAGTVESPPGLGGAGRAAVAGGVAPPKWGACRCGRGGLRSRLAITDGDGGVIYRTLVPGGSRGLHFAVVVYPVG